MRGGTKKSKEAKEKGIKDELKKDKKIKKVSLSVKVKKPSKRIKKEQPVDNELILEQAKTEDLKIQEPKIIYEQTESQKNYIMWGGIAFFMALIIFFWIFNLKQQFKKVTVNNEDVNILKNWDKMSEEMEKQMTEMQTGIDQIKKLQDTLTSTSTAANTATTTPIATSTFSSLPEAEDTQPASSSNPQLDLLKRKLENLEKK